jgi:RNA polymerase sigma-70 factor (ECF subfamily)
MVLVLSNHDPRADDARVSGDAALMRAAAGGDNGAWAAIVSANLEIVHRSAYRLVRDTQLAEDIAQESFVRLWKLADAWQPRGRISTWLCHVARNLAIDAIRRETRARPQELDDETPDRGPTPLESLAARETETDVGRAIDALPARQREAIRLVHFGECSGTAAADILGISVEALESLLARARRSLKAALLGQQDE